VALTIGSFDGVHLGHVDVIQHVVAAAKADGSQPALITFEPHPRAVLDPANSPQSITTLQEKLALIEATGIEHAIVMRFDRELSSLSPQEFIDRLAAVMDLRRWVIGYDFAFGRGRTGSAQWLREHGHHVDVVPPFLLDGHELHSSEVRRLITSGDVEHANRLLGREYAMAGPVEAYAGRARSSEGDFVAALSVGYRPTFGGTQMRVEAFLLDFEGDLYQKRIELRFVRYLHPDIKFPTPEDLVIQLKQDVADTRRIVGK